jgi:hypothetical protein
VVAPDCGMKYLTRDVAFAKLVAMVRGAELVRAELTSSVPAASRSAGLPPLLKATPDHRRLGGGD